MKKAAAKHPEVALVMGSDSDWPVLQPAIKTLREFGVACEVRVLSAHRTPDEAAEFSRKSGERGLKVIIAAAGGAAHLAGTLAAHTILPVIGIPVKGSTLDGLDALLATLQMPAGVPVATVTLGSAGPVNAAILAVQILAIDRPLLREKLVKHKRDLQKKVRQGNEKVQKQAEKIL